MELSNDKIKELTRKLLQARLALMVNNGFYGLLLMGMKVGLKEDVKTACTDGLERIWFAPKFLDSLNEKETEYVLMHEIGHCVFCHGERLIGGDPEMKGLAEDIVINSNILLGSNGNPDSISLHGKISEHRSPDGKEGYQYTTENVYEMLLKNHKKMETWDNHELLDKEDDTGSNDSDGKGKNGAGSNGLNEIGENGSTSGSYKPQNHEKEEEWQQNFVNICKSLETRAENGCPVRGLTPAYAKRLLQELTEPKIDWRRILQEFVQEDILDYSFAPPDRRFDGGDFFLPDLNDPQPSAVKNILFMIDTSGSMSEKQITEAYSEIKGAIDQFGGKLAGWLGFFDAVVVPPKPFEDEESFRLIRPEGGGGTSFDIIFDYVRDHMADSEEELPASIIIMTDGYAPYPEESAAMGIPVMWLIVRDEKDENTNSMPPWGRTLNIK